MSTRPIATSANTEIRVSAGTPHGFDLIAPESTISRAAVSEAEDWPAKTLGVLALEDRIGSGP